MPIILYIKQFKLNIIIIVKQNERINFLMEEEKLDQCQYVQKGALWISEANKVLNESTNDSKSNFGYYGLSLKSDNPYIHKVTSSTGKKVNKIETSSGSILNTWDTIAKAASYEKLSPSKLSRSISNNIMIDGNYHYITISNN